MWSRSIRSVLVPFTLATSLAGIACGGGDSPTAPQFTVGPNGGSVEFLGGLISATFPAGAVDSNVTFTASLAGGAPTSPTMIPGSGVAIAPAGYQLNVPAAVSISVNASNIPAGSGILPNELRLFRLVGSSWELVPGSSYNEATGELTADITTLGTYAVMGLPVASVVITPASPNVLVGGNTALTAQVRATGAVNLPDRPVSWTSLSSGVATVSTGGVVTGVSEGAAAVIAAAAEHADTVTVTVVPPGPVGPFNEPAGYFPIVDRAFNTKAANDSDRGIGSFPSKTTGAEGYDGIEYLRSALTIQQDATAPLSPPNVMRAAYPAQVVTPGSTYAPGAFQTQGFTSSVHGSLQYRELYMRTAFRVSANWQGHPTGVSPKLVYLRTNGDPRAEPFLLLDGSEAPYRLTVNLQGSGLDPRNAIRGLASNAPSANTTDVEDMQLNTWYVVEVQLILNTPGNPTGVFRMWLNGTLTHEYTDISFLPGGTQLYWSNGHFNSTWGGQGGTIPEDMFLFWDHVYFSGKP